MRGSRLILFLVLMSTAMASCGSTAVKHGTYYTNLSNDCFHIEFPANYNESITMKDIENNQTFKVYIHGINEVTNSQITPSSKYMAFKNMKMVRLNTKGYLSFYMPKNDLNVTYNLTGNQLIGKVFLGKSYSSPLPEKWMVVINKDNKSGKLYFHKPTSNTKTLDEDIRISKTNHSMYVGTELPLLGGFTYQIWNTTHINGTVVSEESIKDFWKLRRSLTIKRGTYNQNDNGIISSQYIVDGEPFGNATCSLYLYSPEGKAILSNKSMEGKRDNGIYTYSMGMPNNVGTYTAYVSCKYGGATDYTISEIEIKSNARLSVSGTEYIPGEDMKLFSQLLVNDKTNDNATCLLTMYYPDNTYLLHYAQMTSIGENGIYYYNGSQAPSILGVYMVSVECTYPSLDLISETYGFSSFEDTYIDEQLKNANYGTSTTMGVDNISSGKEQISLVKISDLNFSYYSGSTILSADLFLYQSTGTGTDIVSAYEINSTWAENTVTWNTMPQINTTKEVSSELVSTLQKYYDFDVLDSIQRYVSGANSTPYYGWAFRGESQQHNFFTSEYVVSNYLPYLSIVAKEPTNDTSYVSQITEIKVVNYTWQNPDVVAEYLWNSSAFGLSNAYKNISLMLTRLYDLNTTSNQILGNVSGLPQKITDLNNSLYSLTYKVDSLDSRIAGNFSLIYGNFTRNYEKIRDLNRNFSLVFGNLSQIQASQGNFTFVLGNLSLIYNDMNNNFDLLFNNISNLEGNLDKNFTLIFGNLSEFRSEVKQNFSLVFGNLSTIYNGMTHEFELLRQNLSYINASTSQIGGVVTKVDQIYHNTRDMNHSFDLVFGNLTVLQTTINNVENKVDLVLSNLSYMDSKNDNNFNLVFGNLSQVISDNNNNFNLVFGNLSALDSKLDANFNLIFSNFSSLEQTTNNNFNLVFNNFTALNSNMESNFSIVYSEIDILQNDVNNSFDLVFGNISLINSNLNSNFSLLFGNLSLIYNSNNNSFNLIFGNLSAINEETQDITQNFSLVFGNFSETNRLMENNFTLTLNTLNAMQTAMGRNFSLTLGNLSIVYNKIDSGFDLVLNNISITNSNLDGNFTLVFSNLSAIKSDTNSIQNDMVLVFGNLTVIDSRIQALQNDMTLVFGNLTNIYTDTQGLSQDMTLVFGNLSDIYWSIQALNNSFDLVYGNISIVLNDTNTILIEIDDLNFSVEADLVNLTNRLIEINITTYQLQEDLGLLREDFNNTLRISIITNPIWYANNTAVIFFKAEDAHGRPVNVTNRRIELVDPSGSLLINTTSMTGTRAGYWKYSYYVSAGASTGQYLVRFYGSFNGEDRVAKYTPRVHVGGVFDNIVMVTESCSGKVFANITIINFGDISQDVTVRYWVAEGSTAITGVSQQTFYVASKQRTTLGVVKEIPAEYVLDGNEKRIVVELIHNPMLPKIVSFDTFYSTDIACEGEPTSAITGALFLPFREEREFKLMCFFILALMVIYGVIWHIRKTSVPVKIA